jgi:signal transduction histidine kinase
MPRGGAHVRSISALISEFGIVDQRTGHVLVVDDERPNLVVLRGFLEDRWHVHEASSGQEALAIASSNPLDVVLTDHRMPGMTGVELLSTLRGRGNDAAGIVLTAYADLPTLESAINKAGAFRFLRKPWEPADVQQSIEQGAADVAQRRTIALLVALLAERNEALQAALADLRAREELTLHLERIATIGRLSAGVTHDLKNVIVSLRAAEGEAAASAAVPPRARETITEGLAATENLLRTLQTLHDFARTGTLTLELETVDLARIVRDALALARLDVESRMRRISSEVEPRLPAIRAHRQKVTQVLVNLLRNALHATEGGGEVRITARARGAGAVEFAVDDAGPGVAPELRAKLFQPFVSTKAERGLGMGLYMARLVVESHCGTIEVKDGPLGGARFEVVLPAAAAGPSEGDGS